MYIKHRLYEEDIGRLANLDIDWKRLDGKAFLITGAAGMIGTVLVDTLMRRNIQDGFHIHVFGMGRSLARAEERFGEYLKRPDFTFITGDINKEVELPDKLDYIIHCASNTHPRAYASDPIGTIMTNVTGTENLLRSAAKRQLERVLFLSSVEIYGENRKDAAFQEKDCGYIDCNTLRAGYPEGKRVGEALCQAYRASYGVDVVIPRLCRVYGPTMLPSDSKAAAQFIRNAVSGKDIVLKSDGTQYFSYCYAADAVSALLYILLYGENGEAYNVAGKASDIQLKDLAGILAEKANRRVVFELPDKVEQAGFSKATKAVLAAEKLIALGWESSYSIREGLTRTVDILCGSREETQQK